MIRHTILFKAKHEVATSEIDNALAMMRDLKNILPGVFAINTGECQFHDEKSRKFHTITCESNPNPEDIQFLNDGIIAEHKRKKNMKPLDFFAYFIRDDQGLIVGGCAGDNMYGGLFVGQLWVTEDLRGKGYGTQLMSLTEDLARKSQCRFITANTFDWEALDFYKKLGFYVEFARRGFDKNSVFYFLRKDLSALHEVANKS